MAKVAHSEITLPIGHIDRLLQPVLRFLHVEAASGAILLTCTVVALAAANSPLRDSYLDFWKTEVGLTFGEFEFRHSLKHLINDGLMAIFFFVIGMEVKREIVLGELGDFRRAALPIAAAIGGMVVPAGIYFAMQYGQSAVRGWGIPMATDIAFVVGCLAVLGSRVPHNLRIFVLSLAIVDDIGAILVIAIGYSASLNWNWLLAAAAGIAVVRILARGGVRRFPVYIAMGIFIWYAFHESGVHATLAGVIVGLMTPATPYLSEGVVGEFLERAGHLFEGGGWTSIPHRAEKVRRFQHLTRETISPLEYLEGTLHPWTGFVIMPLFALANAAVPIQLSDVNHSIAVAVIFGLVIGKPVGILAFSWLAVKFGWARFPAGLNWGLLASAACLAGIGFTMALFIAGLALQGEALDIAKVGILMASTASAIIGFVLLLITLPKRTEEPE